MLRTYRVMVALILIVIVEGCWIPEKFTARIVVHEDGSYTYTYDGILPFALALDAAKEGKLTPKDEAVFKKEVVRAYIRQQERTDDHYDQMRLGGV